MSPKYKYETFVTALQELFFTNCAPKHNIP